MKSSSSICMPFAAGFLAVALAQLTATSAFADFVFQGLGFLPGDTAPLTSKASGVSADGSVVTGTDTTPTGRRAFRWTAATGLSDLGVVPTGVSSTGGGISGNGAVIVGDSTVPGSTGPSYWTAANGMISIAPNGHALGASSDGSVITGYLQPFQPFTQPFRWTSGTGVVPLGFAGHAYAISSDGSTIIGDTNPNAVSLPAVSNGHAFFWTAATGAVSFDELIPGLPKAGAASAVSSDGSVIVGLHASVNGTEAFRWTAATGSVDLGDLPGGVFTSWAKAVSADGSIVVGIGNVVTVAGVSTGDPFIWDAANGMQDLRSVLTSGGANLTGWTLTDATGISADGRTIVGTGIDPAGNTEAWVATVPEPASICFLAALSIQLFHRRRPQR